jgi:hypothetical protein
MSKTKLKTQTQLNTQEDGEVIELKEFSSAWIAWSAQSYDSFQPIAELFDNAAAAIMTALAKPIGHIYIKINFESNKGSIEHSGGTTFPHTGDELVRCLTYGGKRQTNLNEHGCGLKTSLAILDKPNKEWEIWIKVVIDGNLHYYSIKAPYSNHMRIKPETYWPGENQTAEPGSFIKFPIKKEMFKELYATKDAKMADTNDLHNRIKCKFSHLWMLVDPIINRSITIHYNEDTIAPFSFLTQDVYEFVDDIKKSEFKLSTGPVCKVEQLQLKKVNGKKIPGSYMFKYAMDANGVYIFKNGRLIQIINSGELYKRVIGSSPDNHHNGIIIIVNMTGNQDQLPPTVPTKNKFGQSELFNEFLDSLHEVIVPPKREQACEQTNKLKYMTDRANTLKSMGIKFDHHTEKSFRLSDTVRTPPIDGVEIIVNNVSVTIMEFKESTKLQSETISQMFFYWSLVSKSEELQGKMLQPVIMLQSMDNNQGAVSDSNKFYLQFLNDNYGCNMIIRNFKNEELFKPI